MQQAAAAASPPSRHNFNKRRRKEKKKAAATEATTDPGRVLLGLIKKATTTKGGSTGTGTATATGNATSYSTTSSSTKTNLEEHDVDQLSWKEIKKLLRGGDETLAKQAFTFLLGQLRDRHPWVRIRALLLLDRLVERSTIVRAELAGHIRDVLDLTVGSARGNLPSPVEESRRLKAKTLEVLEDWNDKFAGQHPELRVAYLHLKEVAGLAFPCRQAQRKEEAKREEVEAAERIRSLGARYQAHQGAMEQGLQELQEVLTQMETCFGLIVPDMRKGLEALGEASSATVATTTTQAQDDEDNDSVEWESEEEEEEGQGQGGNNRDKYDLDDEDDDDDDEEEEQADEEELNLHGLGSAQFYEIEVELPWLEQKGLETADLKPVFDQLRELYGVLQGRLLPQAEEWCRLLIACAQQPEALLATSAAAASASAPGRQPVEEEIQQAQEACRRLLQAMSTLKTQALQSLQKCKDLGGAKKKKRDKKKQRRQGHKPPALPVSTLELQAFLTDEEEKRKA